MKRQEISEKQWNRIKDKFPPEKKPQGGWPGKSNREMLNAILYWLNTGIPWRDLPERFGPWQSVLSAPVIKCKKTPKKYCSFSAGVGG